MFSGFWCLQIVRHWIFIVNSCEVIKHKIGETTKLKGIPRNNNAPQWRRNNQTTTNRGDEQAELSQRVDAQSEDTELIMDALLPGPDHQQFYSLLLSGNSVPTDVFTQPLLPVIKELSACVCGNNWRFTSGTLWRRAG